MKTILPLVLRVTQFLFAVIIMGLSGYVINWYNTDIVMKSPTQVNFLVAVPVLSILSILYTEGTSRFSKSLYHPYVAVGLDILNSILYFAGFIALGVFLSGLFFCHGTVCGAARADSVFAAVSWCAWTASATLAGLEVFRGARKPNPRTQAAFVETKDAASQA